VEILTWSRICPFQRSWWYRLCETVEWKWNYVLFSGLMQ